MRKEDGGRTGNEKVRLTDMEIHRSECSHLERMKECVQQMKVTGERTKQIDRRPCKHYVIQWGVGVSDFPGKTLRR